MLYSIGTKVKFLHSKEEGTITELLGDGMVNVYLPASDMTIPAALEDLVQADNFFEKSDRSKTKVIIEKPAKAEEESAPNPPKSQYSIIKSLGIQLAFDPIKKAGASAERYELYLINDTQYDAVFAFRLNRNGRKFLKLDGKLQATSTFILGSMPFDFLNDQLEVMLDVWQFSTAGKGERLHKVFRIKPQQFFKKVQTAPLLNRPVHLYRVFENFEPKKSKESDLRRHIRRKLPEETTVQDVQHNVLNDLSVFTPEIDLHIDKLVDEYRKMSNTEIIRIQLSHFESFLEKALRLGVPRVFVIHGIGKGRLRNEIATRLMQNPNVTTFKNEFHPRYGWGATEVIF